MSKRTKRQRLKADPRNRSRQHLAAAGYPESTWSAGQARREAYDRNRLEQRERYARWQRARRRAMFEATLRLTGAALAALCTLGLLGTTGAILLTRFGVLP